MWQFDIRNHVPQDFGDTRLFSYIHFADLITNIIPINSIYLNKLLKREIVQVDFTHGLSKYLVIRKLLWVKIVTHGQI